MKAVGKKQVPWTLSALLGLAFLAISPGWPATAWGASVTVLLSEASGPYLEVAEGIRSVLESAPGGRIDMVVQPVQSGGRIDFPKGDGGLIVAVGTGASQAAAAANPPVPVLCVLIPKRVFDLIARQQPDARGFSALYLDQPAIRQLGLIRLVLPEAKKVGLLLGPDSSGQLRTLQAAAREAGLAIFAETIGLADDLIPSLQRVLAESDVVLALPDPLVFNRDTTQAIMLTSYRYHDPVIGFSQAYVRAGALAGVFSTPAQIGRQAGEIVQRVAGRPGALPPPQYPRYFSVGVNRQVARSLGREVEEEAVLQEKLKRLVEPQP